MWLTCLTTPVAEPRLVTPWDTEELLLDVIASHHREHIATAERRQGLQPGTLQDLGTVDRLARLDEPRPEHRTPSLLLCVTGVTPSHEDYDGLSVFHTVGCEVRVEGAGPGDTLHKRDVITWAVIECILTRTPLDGDPISGVRLRDVENGTIPGAGRHMATARVVVDVDISGAVTRGKLPRHRDERTPPGTPGGAPLDPHDPPVPPTSVREVRHTITNDEVAAVWL